MRNKLTLLAFLIIGLIAGYNIINYFIVPINYIQYVIIEIVVSVFHVLFNYSKKELSKTNNE